MIQTTTSNDNYDWIDEVIRQVCYDFENPKVDSVQAQVDAKARLIQHIEKEFVSKDRINDELYRIFAKETIKAIKKSFSSNSVIERIEREARIDELKKFVNYIPEDIYYNRMLQLNKSNTEEHRWVTL